MNRATSGKPPDGLAKSSAKRFGIEIERSQMLAPIVEDVERALDLDFDL